MQKSILYKGWIDLPSSDQIKEYYDRKSDDPVVTEDDESSFKKLGYSASQIRHIREQLENAGYCQQD